MADSDGESSVSSGFLGGLARDLAPGKETEQPNEASSSSDDCADPLFRPFTPGIPAAAHVGCSVYSGKAVNGAETGGTSKATSNIHQVTGRQPVAAPPCESDDGELGRIFMELETAEMLRASRTDADSSDGPLKRRRCNETAAESPACLPMPSQETSMELESAEPAAPRLPPSEKVMEAFAALGMPITYVVKEIEQKSRKLAFRVHPDKVKANQRGVAAQQFRKIQDAKRVILAWLTAGDLGQDSENSDSDEDVLESCSNGEASVSDEEQDELKACGIRQRSQSRSPSEHNSDEESGGDGFGAVLAMRSGTVRSDTSFALGVNGPSAISTLRQQARALRGQAPGQSTCSECLAAKPLKGLTVCAECRKEEQALLKLVSKHPNEH